MVPSNLPLLILCGPLLAALVMFAMPARRTPTAIFEILHLASLASVLVISLMLAAEVLAGNRPAALDNWLYVDAVSVIFLVLIGVVGCLTGLYSLGYVRHDLHVGHMDKVKVKIYYSFFSLFLFTMLLAATSNNIIMMWVSVEATTLGSAFLVGLYAGKSALEAAWKYVIICTVGVAFGLYGTVLAYANGSDVLADPHQAILWTSLAAHAADLDPLLAKLSFVFVLIGFGTKAGLFPMHAWLPDAHSEAPSPVSGLLSGVLLKCALFVIIRYYALTMRAIGPEFPQTLVIILGSLSVAVAALLFFVQKDLKRKLAYSSVEHVGMMALSLGLGGPLGVGAALLHAINHSLAKSLLFCSSGNVLMKFGTRDLNSVKGMLRVAPASGVLLIIGCLALAGFPPFNVFVSEFMIFAAGLKAGYFWLMIACAGFLTITIAGLIQIIAGSVLGKPAETTAKGDVGVLALAPLGIMAVLVLVMGFAVPTPVSQLVQEATAIILDNGDPVAVVAPWQTTAGAGEAVASSLVETPHSETNQ